MAYMEEIEPAKCPVCYRPATHNVYTKDHIHKGKFCQQDATIEVNKLDRDEYRGPKNRTYD